MPKTWLSVHGLEGTHLPDRLEVPVVVEQCKIVLHGDLSDQAVRGAANRESPASALEVDARGSHLGRESIGDVDPHLRAEVEAEAAPFRFVPRALKHLANDGRRQIKGLGILNELPQAKRRPILPPGDQVDQDGGVDQDQREARSFL